MNTQTIMVQVADDPIWTSEAVHSACILARRSDNEVVLVKMVPVQYPGWLGTELGYMHFTEQDRQALRDYELTLEDYGIQYSIRVMQYAALNDALVQAAESVGAQMVFAQLPNSVIPHWHKVQMALLRRRLAHQQCRLLEQAPMMPEALVEEPETVCQP